ncbi:heavy metal translocating P-type ATPase [Flavobacterium branchiophilum]|uniref:Heavy metal translocating P-type ATPase n=1 Tax=Flavobacterium branchiophilum TaxID=55197 RepID=A0A2H3KCL4_9FLAO|nr:heavy metal translocating P-type ATPase metal-binding domain-containing protein [Flavobacterium branchiophilum]PDS25136.1 heavy metal translocating P-type ATPase [Flavobacterium branchiophilum]
MVVKKCFHCGLDTDANNEIEFDQKKFCCNGCKTVYEIFSINDMSCYYDFEKTPGSTPNDIQGKYDFLKNEDIIIKILDFKENSNCIITLTIPHIHCSSCIWVLENLQRLNQGISKSEVNFNQKKVRIHFDNDLVSLHEIVLVLCSIGYEPYISLENYETGTPSIDRSLTYKLGVAFFCFGNIMLLSFPEYFEVDEFWLNQYRNFFRWLIFALSLPSFVYAASSYYVSAFKSLKSGMLNMDIPIALGIIVMFIRSTFDIIMDYGSGFFDSLTGLIFFMLLGKMFQIKTYNFLSFERDYKSYFPIAVTKVNPTHTLEESIAVYDIQKGDMLLIRNQELIPVDGILLSEEAAIDYSFVTGESQPVFKKSGDTLYAGGKQIGKPIEMTVLHTISQSYLTQLWSNDVFQKTVNQKYKTITDTVSKYFTPILLITAFAGFVFWIFQNTNTAFNVFTAVLIVACPCALALTAPFTFGNVLRILGKNEFYLKNALVIEQMAQIDTIVFDKTGTITSNLKSEISYIGSTILDADMAIVKSILRSSNHPLSRLLYDFLPAFPSIKLTDYEEVTGKGLKATFQNKTITLGSKSFVGAASIIENENHLQTAVHIAISGVYQGKFVFKNNYRKGLTKLFQQLNTQFELKIVSGDNEGEKERLEKWLPPHVEMVFNQKPEQKLDFIKQLQIEGKRVMMIGDGLNDAGALAQSHVGISISEDVNVFSPACDAILAASKFEKIPAFLAYSQQAMTTIKWSFTLSILYNIVGLGFALTGQLQPLVAAIIMPLSTITIVSFVTITSTYFAKKL